MFTLWNMVYLRDKSLVFIRWEQGSVFILCVQCLSYEFGLMVQGLSLGFRVYLLEIGLSFTFLSRIYLWVQCLSYEFSVYHKDLSLGLSFGFRVYLLNLKFRIQSLSLDIELRLTFWSMVYLWVYGLLFIHWV